MILIYIYIYIYKFSYIYMDVNSFSTVLLRKTEYKKQDNNTNESAESDSTYFGRERKKLIIFPKINVQLL
jgi:hypothetical protein